MFDPEKFGQAMGEAIRKAVEPLQQEIATLKSQLAAMPAPAAGKDGADGRDGKDCDMEVVKSLVADAVKAIPVINGKDGADGKDGDRGERGEAGKDGADGLGQAGAMIDRDGALQITMTNGEVKNLGVVVGKDGTNGKDGADGIGLDAFEMEYLEETHEVRIKAGCGGRTKELRYPAGGIRPAGYWREGTKALAGQVWTHDGSGWVAKNATTARPEASSEDWILIARKGRDGERGQKGADGSPPAPIKLKD